MIYCKNNSVKLLRIKCNQLIRYNLQFKKHEYSDMSVISNVIFDTFIHQSFVSPPTGTGDSEGIAGLKCRDLTCDVSRQCRGCAGVLTSRQYSGGK